jgi:predicted ATPase
LAKTLEEDVKAIENGCFVEGKHALNSSDAPYSGIAKAFGEICKKIKNSPNGSASIIAEIISETLEDEVETLIHLIPKLDDVVSSYTTVVIADKDIEHGHEPFKNAFRTLTRVLCSQFSPMVMVLDDLQWADVSSLEVIDFPISDIQNPNPLMIVGSYRSSEVDENSILFNKIRTLDEKKAEFGINIADVELGSCQIDDVNKIIMAMMSIDDEDLTCGLTEECFKRTLGNPFFLIEFMVLLQSEGLVTCNLGLMKWVWGEEEIDNATMSAANVVGLLRARIRKLPPKVQLLLQYAACLTRSSFSVSMLELIWKKHALISTDDEYCCHIPTRCTGLEENFIEICGDQQFRWVHDNGFMTRSRRPFYLGTKLFYHVQVTVASA